jgi:hypothetical protein
MVASDVRGRIETAISEQLGAADRPKSAEEAADGGRLETAARERHETTSERERLEATVAEREGLEAATREQLGAAVRALDPEGEQPR